MEVKIKQRQHILLEFHGWPRCNRDFRVTLELSEASRGVR